MYESYTLLGKCIFIHRICTIVTREADSKHHALQQYPSHFVMPSSPWWPTFNKLTACFRLSVSELRDEMIEMLLSLQIPTSITHSQSRKLQSLNQTCRGRSGGPSCLQSELGIFMQDWLLPLAKG